MTAPRFDLEAYRDFVARSEGGAVLVPRWVVNELTDAFAEYENGLAEDVDLDRAFGATSSKRNARVTLQDQYWWIALAGMVLEEKVEAEVSGTPISDDVAFGKVIDRFEAGHFTPSQDTVRRAWRRWGEVLRKIEAAGMPIDE